MTTGIRNLTRICLAAVLAFGLAACGGGGATKSAAELEMERLAAEEMACTDAGGRWNADNTCTSAAELVAEAAQEGARTACESIGGRFEADGSCTSAAQVEMERLAAEEMACTGAGGQWADNTCTSAAELEMACTDAGGRYESDGSCTSAAALEMERLAAEEATCTSAGGRWNADDTCTSAAELVAEAAEMACASAGGRYNADGTCSSAAEVEMERLAAEEATCTSAGGRWNADNTCTSATELVAEAAEMACTDAGGRYEADGTCTSAADVETERLAAAEMACTGAGGRWNADDTCTSAAELEMACTDAGGRWNADNTCTSAAQLAQMACTDAGGRYEADGTCTSAEELERMACVDAGGRYETDGTCTSAEMLAQMGVRDRVIGKDRAIEAAANIGIAGPTEANILISRAAGAAASVRVGAPLGYTASDMAAMANPGWAGSHLTRSVSGATQHLFVYTDIEGPTRVQFYDFDRDPTTTPRYTDPSPPSHSNPYGPGDTLSPFPLTASLGSLGSLDSTKFDPPGLPKDGNVTQTFRGTATGGAAGAAGTSFKGNFNGAPGTYTCTTTTGTDCDVTITPGGTYSTADTWTFTPELNSTAWRVDSEFMSFGWWMQEPNSANGTYTFEYYADGSTVYAPPTGTAPDTLATGTATYSGRAAGKYVVQNIGDAGVTGGVAHQFTAAATLNASFSAAANSISGTISGFTADDGSSPGWAVTLHSKTLGAETALGTGTEAGFPVRTQTDPSRPGYDGTTATIGDQTAYGDWTGQYFGNASGTGTAAYPLGVGGTFQADNESVSIAGAFGARRP